MAARLRDPTATARSRLAEVRRRSIVHEASPGGAAVAGHGLGWERVAGRRGARAAVGGRLQGRRVIGAHGGVQERARHLVVEAHVRLGRVGEGEAGVVDDAVIADKRDGDLRREERDAIIFVSTSNLNLQPFDR